MGVEIYATSGASYRNFNSVFIVEPEGVERLADVRESGVASRVGERVDSNPQGGGVGDDVGTRQEHLADQGAAFVFGAAVVRREESHQRRLRAIGEHLDRVGHAFRLWRESSDQT
jgi:hypothetical protein